jgi:hypothetical protein
MRVAKVKAAVGPGHAGRLVFGVLVLDDGAVDVLTGGSGADWFIKGSNDIITDLATGEQVD